MELRHVLWINKTGRGSKKKKKSLKRIFSSSEQPQSIQIKEVETRI